MPCKICASETIQRSHRENAFEILLSWIDVYPYRCKYCQERSYQRRRRHRAEDRSQNDGSLGTRKNGPPKNHRGRPETRSWKRRERLRTHREMFLYGLALLSFLVLLYWGVFWVTSP